MVLIGLVMIVLCGCGEKKITVKGADGKEYESYQECCAANDYEAAHQFLAKMESLNDEKLVLKIRDAEEYVFKQEALYLMSQNDEAAKKRLLYLLKEMDADNPHIDMLIELAIEDDDKPFVKRLANQYKTLDSNEGLSKVVEYLSSKETEENRQYLAGLLKKLDEEDMLIEFAVAQKDSKLIKELATTSLTMSNTLLISGWASINDKECSEMILALLANDESGIPGMPATGLFKSNYHGEFQNDAAMDYHSKVTELKKDCNMILDIAIKEKNLYLAQKVVNRMRTNISIEKLGTWDNFVNESRRTHNADHKAYKVALNKDEATSAKTKLNEATRSGAFK